MVNTNTFKMYIFDLKDKGIMYRSFVIHVHIVGNVMKYSKDCFQRDVFVSLLLKNMYHHYTFLIFSRNLKIKIESQNIIIKLNLNTEEGQVPLL